MRASGITSTFLLTPLREGRHFTKCQARSRWNFYSRPCGRGDKYSCAAVTSLSDIFLLTPLREGRLFPQPRAPAAIRISTHAPAGGATFARLRMLLCFLPHFYSRPCGRGDAEPEKQDRRVAYFYSRPCGRGDPNIMFPPLPNNISTHAPAGGATAIFHKSVMRFCGKLPKDDTVLCLASFGFPRRDPKAVYLAWISCANLPQKCVRQGLALKDQGTSCFHEGLASHAFDPVLV